MAEVKEGISLTHAYKHHKAKKKAKGEKAVSMKEFKEVMKLFNRTLVQRVVTGFHTQFPHKMGILRIVRKKADPDRMAIDFKATKEHGMTIYHDNRHSDGWYGEWNWSKPNHIVKNMVHYTFTPTRELKSFITEVFNQPNGYKRYMAL